MIELFKIYGERHSGTNYLTKLLELNYTIPVIPGTIQMDVKTVQDCAAHAPAVMREVEAERIRDALIASDLYKNMGWKHQFVDTGIIKHHEKYSNIGFICISKSPYAFLNSLFHRPHNNFHVNTRSLSEFIRSPWITLERENLNGKILINPVELWNIKHRSYLALREQVAQTILIQYEDLLRDYNILFSRIRDGLSVENVRAENYLKSTKKTQVSSDDNRLYQEKYLNFHPDDYFTMTDIDHINGHLDRDVMEAFGYEIFYPKKGDV